MNKEDGRTGSEQHRIAASPPPRRRFRLVRLEERIAPKKGGKGTHNCGGGGTSGGTDTTDCPGSY